MNSAILCALTQIVAIISLIAATTGKAEEAVDIKYDDGDGDEDEKEPRRNSHPLSGLVHGLVIILPYLFCN